MIVVTKIVLDAQTPMEMLVNTGSNPIHVFVTSPSDFYIGSNNTLTPENGLLKRTALPPLEIDLNPGDALWGIPVSPQVAITVFLLQTDLPAFVISPVIISSGKTLKSAAFTLAATGTVVPAVPGKKIKVYSIVRSFTNTVGCNFRSGASTNLEGSVRGLKDTSLFEAVTPPSFLMATAAGQSLDLVLTGSGVNGRVSYYDDDAT